MPEIISHDRVLAKLREFDNRLDGAFAATKILESLKKDAEKLVESIGTTQADSAEIQRCLQQAQEEWEELKAGILETQRHSDEARQKLLDQFDQALAALDVHFSDAVQLLRQENEESRFEHSQFVEASRDHAEKAAKDSKSVICLVSQAKELLTTIKEDIHSTINTKLGQIEALVVSRFDTIANEWKVKQKKISSDFIILSQELSNTKESLHAEIDERLLRIELLTVERLSKIENEWKEQVSSLNQGLAKELISFREEVKNNLVAHQQGTERQITEFLYKQNVLIQNLTQQIDGFQRATQTLTSEQQQMSRKISTLEVGLSKFPEQALEIGTLQKEMQEQGTRLEQIITRLQGIPIIKSSFKNL